VNDQPTLSLNIAAADAVMNFAGIGLRAYATAAGFDPSTDFSGLDMRGWELAGQDLRGFNLSGCDLRGTGVQYARIDGTTALDGAMLDSGVEAGSTPLADWDNATLIAIHGWARRLCEEDRILLQALGREVSGALA
jgi:hypothetical protein